MREDMAVAEVTEADVEDRTTTQVWQTFDERRRTRRRRYQLSIARDQNDLNSVVPLWTLCFVGFPPSPDESRCLCRRGCARDS